MTEQVDQLAAIIRHVDGGNRLGAGALAEAILSHPDIGLVLANSEGPALTDKPEFTEDDTERLYWIAVAAQSAGKLPPDSTIRRLTDGYGFNEHEQRHCLAAARVALARWGCQPAPPAEGEVGELVAVPVSDETWRDGWLNSDGECWWCPPKGPAYWQMANPAMVYGGWVLPAHALPLPQGEVEK